MKFVLIESLLLVATLSYVHTTYVVYPPKYELSDSQTTELMSCLGPTENEADPQSKYEPICGTDGFSYYNKHQMKCLARTIPSVAFAFYGRCPNEPMFLPLESARGTELLGKPKAFADFQHCLETCAVFRPVCGNDLKTYTSPCALECAKGHRPTLELKGNGFCLEDQSVDGKCPEILQPFCGTDGITYLNYCHLKFAQLHAKELLPAHMGDCVRRLITVKGELPNKRKKSGCGCGGGGGGCGGCGK
nr:serine protease inhibitor dipetalogastin-like [Aedes albopictus]